MYTIDSGRLSAASRETVVGLATDIRPPGKITLYKSAYAYLDFITKKLPASVSFDDAGIYCEALSGHQSLNHTAAQDRFEHLMQCTALLESTMSILGECRVIRNCIVQAEAAKPAIG
jgi:hypothetical protein